jgi:hypothetical protein
VPSGDVPRLSLMICAYLLGHATGEVTGGLPPSPTGENDYEHNLSDLVRLVEVTVRAS